MTIRLVTTEDQPTLTRSEMQERGNKLVTDARQAAVRAVRASMHEEFLEKNGRALTAADIRRWRGRAREALKAWREVESLTTELLNELARIQEGNTTDE